MLKWSQSDQVACLKLSEFGYSAGIILTGDLAYTIPIHSLGPTWHLRRSRSWYRDTSDDTSGSGMLHIEWSTNILISWTTDFYQIDWKQRRSRPSDRKSRAPGADRPRPRPQHEFVRAPLAASNSTDTTAFATGYIACTVHMLLNIALQTTWLCT